VRELLFQKTATRRPIRIHDLRATVVTLALAAGKTETRVADRTGHRSSNQINNFRRTARTAADALLLSELGPANDERLAVSLHFQRGVLGGVQQLEDGPFNDEP
jgi:integrase